MERKKDILGLPYLYAFQKPRKPPHEPTFSAEKPPRKNRVPSLPFTWSSVNDQKRSGQRSTHHRKIVGLSTSTRTSRPPGFSTLWTSESPLTFKSGGRGWSMALESTQSK